MKTTKSLQVGKLLLITKTVGIPGFYLTLEEWKAKPTGELGLETSALTNVSLLFNHKDVINISISGV